MWDRRKRLAEKNMTAPATGISTQIGFTSGTTGGSCFFGFPLPESAFANTGKSKMAARAQTLPIRL
jgi:hypothetical protein